METSQNAGKTYWINVYHRSFDPCAFQPISQIEYGNPYPTRQKSIEIAGSNLNRFWKLVYRLKVTLK